MYTKSFRRFISLVVATAMMVSVTAAAAEAAVATWLAPQPGQKLATRNVEVAIGYNTHSDLRVTHLELLVDGKLSDRKMLARPDTRGVCSFWWDTAKYAEGPHDLLVKIYAGDQLVSKVSSTGTVGNYRYDLRPPTVCFENIKSGDVLTGLTTLKLSARDDSGEPPLVSLLVDDSLKLVKNRPPYTYDLDTTSYSDGKHELQTYAYDSEGNKSDPAIVQVAFKNGATKPVVTSVKVEAHPSPERFDEAPPVAALPSITAASHSAAVRGSAGRVVSSSSTAQPPSAPVAASPRIAAEPMLPSMKAATSAKPGASSSSVSAAVPGLAAVTCPSVKVGPVHDAEEVKIPAVMANPAHASSEPTAGVRDYSFQPVASNVSVKPEEPGQISIAIPNRPESTAGILIQRQIMPDALPATTGTFASPSVLADASSAPGTMMAMAPNASLRSDTPVSTFSAVPHAIEETIGSPILSDARRVVASSPASRVRMESISGLLAEYSSLAEIPASDSMSLASSKPVRVAAAVYVKDINNQRSSNCALGCPPPVKKDSRAKLEKKTAPVSGKVKLRDLYEDLNGVLFWDSDTRTVTAISANMKIELTIGSDVVLVNGKKMQIGEPPYIVEGRTFVDVGVYHQAKAFVESGLRMSALTR